MKHYFLQLALILVCVNSFSQAIAPILTVVNNQTVVLPSNTVTLVGSASAKVGGASIHSVTWSQIIGPNISTLASPTAWTTTASGLIPGTYVYQMKVVDNANGVYTVNATVVVQSNMSPGVVCVQVDCQRTLQLPEDSIVLNSQVTTNDSIKSYQWKVISGTAVIPTNTVPTTIARKLTVGTNIFSLTTVTNKNSGITKTDTVIVLPAPVVINKNPVAIIQPISPITLPTNTIVLDGSKSIDSDGVVAHWKWSTGDTTPTVKLTLGAAGTYNYALTVTDDQGGQGTASISVVVNPAPVVVPNVVIQAPLFVVGAIDTLTAVATDPNVGGKITQYGWGKVSGLGTQTILNANSATAIISGLQSGTYSYKVTVWNAAGLTSSSTITFNVSPAIKTITKVITTYYYSDGTSVTTTQQ